MCEPAALFLLVASCLRVAQASTMSFYVQEYFAVYPDQYELFAYLQAIALFVGGFASNIITAVFMVAFEKSPMSKPLILIVKCCVDIPCCALIYLQQSSFILSIAALFAEYLLAKGWTAPAIAMLLTVVDKSIMGISVALMMFMNTVIASFSSIGIGMLQEKFDLSP